MRLQHQLWPILFMRFHKRLLQIMFLNMEDMLQELELNTLKLLLLTQLEEEPMPIHTRATWELSLQPVWFPAKDNCSKPISLNLTSHLVLPTTQKHFPSVEPNNHPLLKPDQELSQFQRLWTKRDPHSANIVTLLLLAKNEASYNFITQKFNYFHT